MNSFASDESASDEDRARRIQHVADDLLRRWADGQSVSLDAALAEHADLLPELSLKLRPVRAMMRAHEAAEATLTHHPSHDDEATVREPRDVGDEGLHIRCPHCRYHVELLEENEFDHITCSTCGSVFSLVDSSPRVDDFSALQFIGHFELITRLGIGSFGAVWKAYDVELDRQVAVKIPRRGQLDPLGEAQFLREARVAAQLRHPHIVSVYEVGREGDLLYIVSDLVQGCTLQEWLRDHRPTPVFSAEMAIKIADALHHAHEKGVVHRDLKPSNVMLDEGTEPRLTDFGLAKRKVGEVTMTVDGQILGTPAYMSPEQAAGQAHHVDRRTDVYSLGVVLFELLTGELPFRGSVQMQLRQKLEEDAPNPRTLDRFVPYDLAVICAKCLNRESTRRYPRASDLRDDLQRFVRGEPIRARPIPRLERLWRWAKRRPAAAAAASLALFLAVAGPAAALRIEGQRRAIVKAIDLKDSLIDDRDQKLAAADATASRLLGDLETLQLEYAAVTGGADLGKLWPPRRGKEPSEQLLREAVVWQPAPANASVEASPREAWETAAAEQLAWGIAWSRLAQPRRALAPLLDARATLERLVEAASQEPRYVAALAECEGLLAACWEGDPAEVERSKDALQRREQLIRQLVTPELDATHQADLLDAELRLAAGAGEPLAPAAIEEAHALQAALKMRFPLPPLEFYRLVCRLCERPTTLTHK